MNFRDLQTQLTNALNERYGEGEAASICRIVMEDAFRYFGGDRVANEAEAMQFQAIKQRLEAGEPVQYVLGEADFFGLKFRVTPAVLIPRQETEMLVAEILDYLKNNALQQAALLDIGLGSGCIAITLKKKMPALQLFGMEKSPEALALAFENAHLILGEKSSEAQFFQGDILQTEAWSGLPMLDVIVSNPPYIPLSEKHLVPQHVQAHEPSLALFVENADSLLFYRVIADFACQKLRSGGALFFECNEFNAPEAAEMLREKGFQNVKLQKDLYGADRILSARKA